MTTVFVTSTLTKEFEAMAEDMKRLTAQLASVVAIVEATTSFCIDGAIITQTPEGWEVSDAGQRSIGKAGDWSDRYMACKEGREPMVRFFADPVSAFEALKKIFPLRRLN